jgi:hypothetical protein
LWLSASGARAGSPRFDYTPAQFDYAVGIAQIAKDAGLTRQTVYRIKDELLIGHRHVARL